MVSSIINLGSMMYGPAIVLEVSRKLDHSFYISRKLKLHIQKEGRQIMDRRHNRDMVKYIRIFVTDM